MTKDYPLGHPDFGKAFPCRCREKEREEERQERLLRYSRLGGLLSATFDTLNPKDRGKTQASQRAFQKALEAARAFAAKPEGWLAFCGPTSGGKTHLAAAIANECLRRGIPALFISTPDLLDHLRGTYAPDSEVGFDELFQQVKDAPLLILDDLGSQSSTPWAREKLHQLLSYRYHSSLPTVFTLPSLEVLEERLRARLADTSLCQIYTLGEEGEGSLGLELLRGMTFDNFNCRRHNLNNEQRQNLEKVYQLAKSYAEKPDGWLVLIGTNSCGKTHLAAAIANYRLQKEEQVYFAVVPDLLDYLRRAYNPESLVHYDALFDKMKTSPLLILDDFGAHSTTPWAQEKLYQLINYRYNARLPTIFTCSLLMEDIERLDLRIASRFLDPRISVVYNIIAPPFGLDRRTPSRARPYSRRQEEDLA